MGAKRWPRSVNAQLQDPDIPPAPDHLDKWASELWHLQTTYLYEEDLLPAYRLMAWALVCEAWGHYRNITEKVAGKELLKTSTTDAKGSVTIGFQANPLLQSRDFAYREVLEGFRSFGLAPPPGPKR